MAKLPERLKIAREKKGLTQRQLAALLKAAPSTVALYETGDRNPDPVMLTKLADVLECSVDYLLGRTDDPTPPEKKPVIDPDLGHDISDLTPEEVELLNRLKKEVAFKNYLEAPEEAKKEFIKAVKLLMQGMKGSDKN